jgi:hypothetical protein
VSLARKHQVWSGQLISIGNTISHMQAHFTIQLVSDHPPDYARAEAEVCCARPRCAVRGRGVLWSSGSLVLPCTAG